ncbi:MAG: DUF333 domain-containing protein [Candidatus Eisenbacteria bacterium]
MNKGIMIGSIVCVLFIILVAVLLNIETNPTKQYCEDQGYEYRIKSVYIPEIDSSLDIPYCYFKDGQSCEAHNFYLGECMHTPLTTECEENLC